MKLARQPKFEAKWFKTFGLVVIAMATSIAITACGNKGGGGAPAPLPVPVNPVPIISNCTGCPPNMTFLSSAVGRVYSADQIELALEFFGGNTNTGTPSQPNMSYYGPFAAQGYVYIGGNMIACGIPAMGPLQVRTIQPGIWGKDGAGRSLEGIYLEAVGGPAPIQMYISGWVDNAVPAVQARDGRTFPFKIKGLLQLKRADAYSYCNVYME